MSRQRGFTIAETLTAGAATVFVGGIAISSFLGFSTALSLSSNRETRSRDQYKAIRLLKQDIEGATKFDIDSSNNLALTFVDPSTNAETTVEYKKSSVSSTSNYTIARTENNAARVDLGGYIGTFSFIKQGDSCIKYTVEFLNGTTGNSDTYVGESRLRNWVRK